MFFFLYILKQLETSIIIISNKIIYDNNEQYMTSNDSEMPNMTA